MVSSLHVCYIVQAKVHLRWRLKLIVIISLSIRMMTSQDRICVQCVTNDSHRKVIWIVTNKYILKMRGKGQLKAHLLRHEGVKPYHCSACPKHFGTSYELKQHLPAHSDYKQFCCGSCGEYFKRKRSVVRHFKKCSVKLGYVSVFAGQAWDGEQTICGLLLVTELLRLTQDLSVMMIMMIKEWWCFRQCLTVPLLTSH